MTIEEARAIIEKTSSPHLKRDMEKFIKTPAEKGGRVWQGQERK